MSVARCLEINARLRAAGITVTEWASWQNRGNGQSSAYEGGIVHHTATAYGAAPAVLVNGRSDLPGPLCNYAGNADGSITVIAAHPANHAGASGGRSMGPLPVTSLFNKRVMGLEIVYPGTSPMTDAQYRTAALWSRIVTDVLGYGDIERARAHAETSITGKWDPGYAPGQTINMAAFRTAALNPLEDELPTPNDLWMAPCTGTDPTTGKPETHAAVAWITVMAYRVKATERNTAELLGRDPLDIDEAAVAADLAPFLVDALAGQMSGLNESDLARIAKAVNDEEARRQAA